MSDSSAVDAALVAKLAADATLAGLMTDGVYFDVAPPGLTKFVIVSQQDHVDRYVQNDAAFEEFTYLVKAVARDTSGADVKTAADRIQTLLSGGTLSPTGYRLTNMHRLERVRYTEDDEAGEYRWQHRGGLYSVLVEPT